MTYTVLGLLGRGGMAVVELAVDEQGRQVARKRVSLSGSAQQIAMARHRIRREAEVLAGFHHPGIVPLLAVEDDGTDVVLVMPRMVGSLADKVARNGPLSPAEVSAIGSTLLDALATAHRQGVVHRDIKPANVLFSANGRAALADFGVAITRHFTPGLTMAGTIIGTPEYIAPEQAAGQRATAASDVFSLGATLAFALTGHGPYGEGEPMALMGRAARGHVEPLSNDIPNDLRRALAAMLDPRLERRPSAAAALGGPRGTQIDLTPPRHTPQPKRGRRFAVVVGIVAVVAAVVAAGAALYRSHERSDGAPRSVSTTVTTVPATTTTTCTPLAYQPCGQPPAPGTDGNQCLQGRADFDGNPANGCEAMSDFQSGQELESDQTLQANLVPANATDTFGAVVSENFFSLCLSKYKVTLVAPPRTTDQVQILSQGQVLATATSTDGKAGTATASAPSCFHSGSVSVTIQVTDLSGQSAQDFSLTSHGSW